MFSNGIILRTGDEPHLIFDKETGEYLDHSGNIVLGNRVWVGERVYVTKKARVADGCIVAAAAVLSRQFDEEDCVIAGNPAAIRKRGIKWLRNETQLEAGSPYDLSFRAHKAKFKK